MTSPGAVFGDVTGVMRQLSHVSLPWLIAGLVLQGMSLGLRSLAWRNILRAVYPARRVPTVGIAAAYVAGVATNGVLPAHAGELAKVGLARLQIDRSETPAVLGSLGVMGILDAVVSVGLTIAVLATGSVPGASSVRLVPHPGWAIAGAAAAVAVFGLVAARLPRVRARASHFMHSLAEAVVVFRRPRRYLHEVALFQLGAWVCKLAVASTLLAAFGLRPTLSSAMLVVVVGSLSALVPASPGGLGTQQLLLVYALGAGAAAAQIVAFSLGMQMTLMLFQTALGLVAIMFAMRIAHPVRAIAAVRTAIRD